MRTLLTLALATTLAAAEPPAPPASTAAVRPVEVAAPAPLPPGVVAWVGCRDLSAAMDAARRLGVIATGDAAYLAKLAADLPESSGAAHVLVYGQLPLPRAALVIARPEPMLRRFFGADGSEMTQVLPDGALALGLGMPPDAELVGKAWLRLRTRPMAPASDAVMVVEGDALSAVRAVLLPMLARDPAASAQARGTLARLEDVERLELAVSGRPAAACATFTLSLTLRAGSDLATLLPARDPVPVREWSDRLAFAPDAALRGAGRLAAPAILRLAWRTAADVLGQPAVAGLGRVELGLDGRVAWCIPRSGKGTAVIAGSRDPGAAVAEAHRALAELPSLATAAPWLPQVQGALTSEGGTACTVSLLPPVPGQDLPVLRMAALPGWLVLQAPGSGPAVSPGPECNPSPLLAWMDHGDGWDGALDADLVALAANGLVLDALDAAAIHHAGGKAVDERGGRAAARRVLDLAPAAAHRPLTAAWAARERTLRVDVHLPMPALRALWQAATAAGARTEDKAGF